MPRAMRRKPADIRNTRNRRALRRATAGAAVICVLAAAFLWVTSPESRHTRAIGGPFSLVADDGRTVTEHSFPGKYLAVYFGYTACQDVCPTTLNTLTAALGRLGEKAQRVQPLFITVDPTRDTPAVLQRYVSNFRPGLLGLTGAPAVIARVAQEYGVVAVAHGTARHITVDHSSVILLFAPDGTLAAPIPADASEMVMAQALARYLTPAA